MSIYARSFTISFGRSPCPGQLPSSLRLPLSGRPPVVSTLLLHVLFCFTIRFSRYHAVRLAFRFPATAPLLYHPRLPFVNTFFLNFLIIIFSLISAIFLYFIGFFLVSSFRCFQNNLIYLLIHKKWAAVIIAAHCPGFII